MLKTVRRLLTEEILRHGLPVAALWADGDSYGGVYVYPDRRIVGLGQTPIGYKDETMDNLDVVSMVELVEHGVRSDDAHWNDVQKILEVSEESIRRFKGMREVET